MVPAYQAVVQGGICRGEAGELPPLLDLTFPPTGLSENLGGMEMGGEGKRKGNGGGDLLPPLASASNTTLLSWKMSI